MDSSPPAADDSSYLHPGNFPVRHRNTVSFEVQQWSPIWLPRWSNILRIFAVHPVKVGKKWLLGPLPRPWPHQSPFGDSAGIVPPGRCDIDAYQPPLDCVVYAGGSHFQLYRQLGRRPWALAQAAPDLMAQVWITHQAFFLRLREYSWATTLRPANCAPTYRAAVWDDFQRPTAWSWAMVASASARSTAMPARQLWPL